MVLFLSSFDPFQGFVTSRQIFVRGGHQYVRRSDEGSGFDLFDEREDFEEAGVEGALAAEKEVCFSSQDCARCWSYNSPREFRARAVHRG